MWTSLDEIDRRLLDGWQRDLPLVPRPFASIGDALGIGEAEVLDRLARLHEAGAISRVGGTCRPNAVGASTLAAVAAPGSRIEEVAAAIGAIAGVNHSYLREDDWNIWFVATGPDRVHVAAGLTEIRRRTGLRVLDCPLVRPFNVDLGFPLMEASRPVPPPCRQDPGALEAGDRPILAALTAGLPLSASPFGVLAERLGRTERAILARLRRLLDAGIVSRLGVIVRHRALGWRSNAMTVWQIAPADAARIGPALARQPGITLCYQRRPVPDVWPYTLYCMVHARSRTDALAILDRAARAVGLGQTPRRALFSVRCFKQTGAMVARGEERA